MLEQERESLKLSDPDEIFRYQLELQFGRDLIKEEVKNMNENQMKKIRRAHQDTISQMLKQKFHKKKGKSKVNVKNEQDGPQEKMRIVNQLNWQWLKLENKIREDLDQQNFEEALPDFECIWIGQEMIQIEKEPKANKFLYLVSCELEVNMYTAVIKTKDGAIKVLRKQDENNREQRGRPQNSQKSEEMGLLITQSPVQ